MFRCQLVLQQRSTIHSHHLISSRSISQLILSNNYTSKTTNPLLSPKYTCSKYLRFQKRSFISAPAPQTVNLMLKGLFVYALVYLSYKFFVKREDRGPRLEIIENHCFSPFHINSILSLIYPKLLSIFHKNSNIYVANKYSSSNTNSDKNDIHSLITNSDNNYNIDIHQKIWIDQDTLKEKDIKKYDKFLSRSWLHSFNFEMEKISFNQINFEITDIVQNWFDNLKLHSFTSNNINPIDDIDFKKFEEENPQKSEKSEDKNDEKDVKKPGIRMTLASTLRFDDELRYKFNNVSDSEVPFTDIKYFENDKFSEYLRSDIHNYKYMKYQSHEIVVIPFKNNDNLSLVLSLPILDYGFILSDMENKKYKREQKYMRYCIHPHDLHNIFDSDAKDIFKDEKKTFEVVKGDNILHDELLQLYIPKIDKEFRSELKDHHIVSTGLNTFWLPLYYSNLCLKMIDCKSYLNINENNAKFELLSIGYFDDEERVWAAMRWKYGLREVALKMNWYNFKQKFKWKKKNKNVESGDDEECKTIVFDRPFDYYLYDSDNQIVYASGTVSS